MKTKGEWTGSGNKRSHLGLLLVGLCITLAAGLVIGADEKAESKRYRIYESGHKEYESGKALWPNPFESIKTTVCVVQPTKGNRCKGVVRFTRQRKGVKVVADIEGLTPNQKHGFHIHEFGDVSGLDGKSAGGHYDPAHTGKHGRPGEKGVHAGDMGNLVADGKGKAHYEATIPNITVAGWKNPILGRAIIIHAKEDDFGQPTGNAGGRIGYGVIGVGKSE